jgi:hypothetical protein
LQPPPGESERHGSGRTLDVRIELDSYPRLGAYPNRPAARHVMIAHAMCNMPR